MDNDKEKKRANNHRYYLAHADKIKATAQAWREAHREEVRKYSREYNRKNADKIKATAQAWRAAHPEKVREYNRNAAIKWREAHPGYMTEYRKAHPGKGVNATEYNREYQREYRKTHSEQIKTYNDAYRAAHREELKRYSAEYRATHKEQIRERNKRYKKSLKEKKTMNEPTMTPAEVLSQIPTGKKNAIRVKNFEGRVIGCNDLPKALKIAAVQQHVPLIIERGLAYVATADEMIEYLHTHKTVEYR